MRKLKAWDDEENCGLKPAATDTDMKTYHVWFSTKHRRVALVEEIGEMVKKVIHETGVRHGIEILALEVELDHTHLLVTIEDQKNLSWAMQILKGNSSREVFLKYPELRLDMGTAAFWQKGYGHRFVHPEEIPIVKRYIQTQAQRPARHY